MSLMLPILGYYDFPRIISVYAIDNDIAKARQVLSEWRAGKGVIDDLTMLQIEVALGNREAANHHAGLIDARKGGSLVLADSVRICMCGAPFDLGATPNFKERIEEAGFYWPPPTPIKYPAKDW